MRIQVGLSLGPVGLGVVMIRVNKLWNKEGKKYFLKAFEEAGSGLTQVSIVAHGSLVS